MPIDRAFTLPGIGLVVTGTIAAGSGGAGRSAVAQPAGRTRAGPWIARPQPSHRDRRRRRALRGQHRRFLSGGRASRAAATGSWRRSGTRRRAARPLGARLALRRSAAARRAAGASSPRHDDVVGRVAVLGAGRLRRARPALCRSISSSRSARCTATVRCCATTPPGTPGGRTRRRPVCAAPRAPAAGPARGARRDHRDRPGAGAGCAARGGRCGRAGAIRAGAQSGAERTRSADRRGRISACRAGARSGCGDRGAIGRAGRQDRRRARRLARTQPDALGPSRPALLAQLRGAAPGALEAALDAALAELAAAGRVVREGAIWRLPEHQPRLTRSDERLWERVHPLLAVDGSPPAAGTRTGRGARARSRGG